MGGIQLSPIHLSRATEFWNLFSWHQDPSHNMCSLKNNKPSATCSAAGGPESIESCPAWFASLWKEQKAPSPHIFTSICIQEPTCQNHTIDIHRRP